MVMNKDYIKNFIENSALFTYSRSSGPGGQNVNKVNTKVTMHLKIEDIPLLTYHETERLKKALTNKINSNGELVLSCDEERTQSKNRSKLIYRCLNLLENSLLVNKKRKPTKPTMDSINRRIETKKRLGLKKMIRNSKDFC